MKMLLKKQKKFFKPREAGQWVVNLIARHEEVALKCYLHYFFFHPINPQTILNVGILIKKR
jgi:hypothetical protein